MLDMPEKFNSLIRMARVAMTVFLLLILFLCVMILAYTFKLSKISVTDASGARIHAMYSVVDASGSRINTRRYNLQDEKRGHHTWRDNRVHGDEYHKNLW
jgi:cell division septal protein FtsQ